MQDEKKQTTETHGQENPIQPVSSRFTPEQEAIFKKKREESEAYLQRIDAEVQEHIKKEIEDARKHPRPRSEQARIADL